MDKNEITDVWIDEAGEISLETFKALKNYKPANQKRIFFTVDPAKENFRDHIVKCEIIQNEDHSHI